MVRLAGMKGATRCSDYLNTAPSVWWERLSLMMMRLMMTIIHCASIGKYEHPHPTRHGTEGNVYEERERSLIQ